MRDTCHRHLRAKFSRSAFPHSASGYSVLLLIVLTAILAVSSRGCERVRRSTRIKGTAIGSRSGGRGTYVQSDERVRDRGEGNKKKSLFAHARQCSLFGSFSDRGDGGGGGGGGATAAARGAETSTCVWK